MRTTTTRRNANTKSVLLAIYHLADGEGLCCHATNDAIAHAAAKTTWTTRAALRDLERFGIIAWLDWRDGLSHRVLVLMDHPDARGFLRHVRRAGAAGACMAGALR